MDTPERVQASKTGAHRGFVAAGATNGPRSHFRQARTRQTEP